LKVAIVGAGYMGRLHAEKFAARRDAKVVAVVDVDAARAQALAHRLGCTQASLGQAEAAVVAVPTERHFDVVRDCLERGLHVLVEKPVAASLEQAQALVALAEKKRLVLQVGHVERYNRVFSALAARMSRPLYIEAERLSGFKQRGADVDVVLDLMIHDIDLVLSLAGKDISAVSACGFKVLTRDIDIANARIEFADGCVASLSASRVSQAPVRKLRVFQPELYVSADLQAGKLRYVRRAEGAIDSKEEVHEKGDALALQAQAFVSSVLKNKKPEVSGDDGLRALDLALTVGRLVRERLARFG
jgi:predicted dehydrogenase